MSSLEIENRRSEVPGSVNIVQHVFDKMNGITATTKDEATIQAIKEVAILQRGVREGREAFKRAKDEMESAKKTRTYIPTGEEIARDVEKGLYRERLDGTER